MMSGYLDARHAAPAACPRRYCIVRRGDGWSISVGKAVTRPFRDRAAAERIARTLQRQADGLNHD